MKAFGIILLALGFLALTYTGFDLAPTEELNHLGMFVSQKNLSIWMAPVIGIIDLVTGFSLLFTPKTWI